MTGTKINGQKIHIKLYEGKASKDNSGRTKDYRNLERKRDHGRKRPHRDGNHSGKSASRRNSKRYQ